MRFHVPQFIEVEDKIFGPLTFKQFIYMTGSAGLAYLTYRIAPSFIAYPIIAVALGVGAMLAFYKINNRPFIFTLQAGFGYVFSSKLYIWKKTLKDPTADTAAAAARTPAGIVPKIGENRLSNMAWDLDVKTTGRDLDGE